MVFQPAKDADLATGYRLVERLGTGGYGDVWKATAPGGLAKAVKFVFGATDGPQAEQELKALNRIKEVRHPFLLSLERIDIVDGQLVIITELADGSLLDRYVACVRAGQQGIPRDELLAHLRDAADALDYMARVHGLQHLDVKPQNLLLVGGRIKVADFGQVRRLGGAGTTAPGITPVYATPEAFDGRVSRYSDQYSLAIVYQEMLTGIRPFPGSTMMQLAAQHIHAAPCLEPLPPSDRPAVARALAKVPEERFPSCLRMVEALLTVSLPDALPPLPAPQDVPVSNTRQLLTNDPTPRGGPAGATLVGDLDAIRETAGPGRAAPPAGDSSFALLPSLSSLSESTDFVLDPALDDLRETAIPATGTPVRSRERFQPLAGARPGIRPTLFLGIGGLAGATLRRLKSRFVSKYGDLSKTPAFRILLVDTDREDLRRTQHDDPGATLAPDETLLAPLHPPEHYRQSAKKLQRWLDRRWLYGIPRSLLTQGLRPLGRLALVDNAAEVLDAIRAALAAITRPEAVNATAHITGAAVRAEEPRVFVVASMTGGTGSGMLVSVAYAVRQILGQKGLSPAGLCGVLLHATSIKPEEREMARVNASATMSELEQLGRMGAAYPGEPESGLMPFRVGPAAFEDCYVIQLGDRLERAAAEAATDAVADYLYLDASPGGGACLDKLRRNPDAAPRRPGEPYSVRTFGLSRVDARGERSDELSARLLCRRLIERWLTEPGADVVQELHRQAQKEAIVRGLEERSLTLVLSNAVSAATGNRPDAFIPQVLARAAAAAGSTQPARMIGHIDTTFAAANERPGETTLSTPTLHAVVRKVAESHGAEIGQKLVGWLSGLLGQPGQRLKAAERTATFFTKTLAAYAKSASERAGNLRSQRVTLRQKIEAKGSNPGGTTGRPAARAAANPRVDRELDAYCRLRLREITEDLTGTLLATVQRHVEAFLQQVADFSRLLRALSDRLSPGNVSGQSRALPRLVLPGPGATPSVNDDTLPSGMVQIFDRSFDGSVLEMAGGFRAGVSLADESFGQQANAGRMTPEQLGDALLSRARVVLQGATQAPDAARLFFRTQGGPERAKATLLARAEAARPKLSGDVESQHVLAALPDGHSGETLNEMLFVALPGMKGSHVPWDEDILICIEAANCRLGDVAQRLIGPSEVPEDLVRSVMTRLDATATQPAARVTFS